MSTSPVMPPMKMLKATSGFRAGLTMSSKFGSPPRSMEIDRCLVSHPAVAEAAAIGKPDELKGEHIKVFVILKNSYTASDEMAQELKMHVRSTVGPLATPDELESSKSSAETRQVKSCAASFAHENYGLSAMSSTLEA